MSQAGPVWPVAPPTAAQQRRQDLQVMLLQAAIAAQNEMPATWSPADIDEQARRCHAVQVE